MNKTILGLRVLCIFGVLPGTGVMPGTAAFGATPGGHWVSAWSTAVLAPFPFPGAPVPAPVADKTIRMIVRPTVGGSRVRVRLSNEFGSSALSIGAAHIALSREASGIRAETDHPLTFAGKTSVTIPAGAPVLSDPVDLAINGLAEISVSIYVPTSTPLSTLRGDAQRESYMVAGDLTGKADLPNPEKKNSWYFLSSVEVWAPASTTTIVALGDSITQGAMMNPGPPYSDWPDQLAQRISSRKMGPAIAVVNEGISGNRVLHDAAGVSALARFDRDVLSHPGVTRLILLEGINDIGFPRIRMSEINGLPAGTKNPFAAEKVSAEEIIMGLRQILARAHEHGIQVFGGTLMPFQGTNSYDSEGEANRQAVNQWIRASKEYDGIFDFDALTRDPARPTRLRAEYDSGDHIHPNAASYKAMADSINLSVLNLGKR